MTQLRMWLPLLLIGVIAFLMRYLFLDSIPVATNLDQLHYILNTKSFILTGTDLSDTINIFELLLFRYPAGEFPQAELTFFLLYPFIAFLPLKLSTVALPNVLLSVGTVIVLYLIVKALFNKSVAIIAALVATFNPWFIYVGRTLYEVVPAMFFYLCFMYIVLNAKGWRVLWALPLMLLAFYSYIGTKLIFLPVVFITLMYMHYFVHKRKYLKQYVVTFLFAVSVVVFFLFQIQPGSGETSRLSELITPNHPAIVSEVDKARQVSLDNPLINLFENKLTAYIKLLIANTFNVFSLSYLFLNGDLFAHLERHGLFYVFDLLFIIVGVFWLYLHKRYLLIYFLLFILISIIPQIIHNPDASGNFAPHITLIFPILIIIISVGIFQFIRSFTNRNIRFIVILLISGIYLFSIFNFFHIYFYQLPMRTGIFDFPTRLLSTYSVHADSQKENVKIFTPQTNLAYKNYLFYTNSVNHQTILEIKHSIKNNIFKLNNVDFKPCKFYVTASTSANIKVVDLYCGYSLNGVGIAGIPQLKDSGSMYRIKNDSVCNAYELPRFVKKLSINELTIEEKSLQNFCETYILEVE